MNLAFRTDLVHSACHPLLADRAHDGVTTMTTKMLMHVLMLTMFGIHKHNTRSTVSGPKRVLPKPHTLKKQCLWAVGVGLGGELDTLNSEPVEPFP